jgi:glyoxylase-like metal-dependent hydrolase (beta-lactamase superfamily II)
MHIEKINQSLYKITLSLTGFEVNMGACIGEDGILLVDAGWNMTAEQVEEKIKELDEGEIKLMIFTHQHGDHIGGRDVLGKEAVYIAHKRIQPDLEGRYYHLDPLPGNQLPTFFVE